MFFEYLCILLFFQSSMSSRAPPKALLQDMVVPPRQLFGPGPSNMADSIAETQSRNLLGHLHPEFVQVSFYVLLEK